MNEQTTSGGQVKLRTPTEADLPALALLFDIANHGDVKRIWSAEARNGEVWTDIAMRRMREPASEIHFSKAVVAEVDGNVAGALFFFRFLKREIPQDILPDMAAIPLYLQPIMELKRHAPTAVFLRDMAVFPEYRGRRLATQMLDVAIKAGFASGLRHAVAIVHETNTALLSHYDKRGMRQIAKAQVLDHVHHAADSHWLLLQLDAPISAEITH